MTCNICKGTDFFETYDTGVNKFLVKPGALTEIIYNTNICKACGNIQVDTSKIVIKDEYRGMFWNYDKEGSDI